MSLDFNSSLGVKGVFTLKVIDAATGVVLEEEKGNNIVLNSGLDIIRRAISSGSAPVVNTLQLGGDATTPTPQDAPLNTGGSLQVVPSEFFAVQPFYYKDDNQTVTFKCIIPPGSGNGSDPEGRGNAYQEAVLSADTGGEHKWFARKTFNTRVKTALVLFEINWDIIFTYKLETTA